MVRRSGRGPGYGRVSESEAAEVEQIRQLQLQENEIAISISCLFLCLDNLRMVASALARDFLVQLHHLLPVMMG